MLWASLVSLLLFWLVCSWAPGYALTRHLRTWRADERLILAVVISLFLLYIAALVGFITQHQRAVSGIVAGICLICAATNLRSLFRIVRLSTVRRLLYVYFVALFVALLCQLLVRHYSGGTWIVDWWLHYEKVEIYLRALPADPQIIDERILDRPPLVNLVCAFFTGLVGLRFETFQVLFTCVGVTAVLPAVLLMSSFARRGGRCWPHFLALLVCLPAFWAHATFTWTKLPAAFFSLCGVWFYLCAIRPRPVQTSGRLYASYFCFAAGVVAHYVVFPLALLCAVHYILFIWRKRARFWREPAVTTLIVLLVVSTWLGYVVTRFGLDRVIHSNNTIHHAQESATTYELLMKMACNSVWTLIPHPLRMRQGFFDQAGLASYVRDYVFLIYQTNAFFVCGTATAVVAAIVTFGRLRPRRAIDRFALACAIIGVAILWLCSIYIPIARDVLTDLFPHPSNFALATIAAGLIPLALALTLRREFPPARPEVWFWRMFIVWLPIAAGIFQDDPYEYGLAFIYFLPWFLAAIALVATIVPTLSRPLRLLLCLGLLIDFALGVALHFHIEHRIFPLTPDGQVVDTMGMTPHAVNAYLNKLSRNFTFLGDSVAGLYPVLFTGLLLCGALSLTVVLRPRTPRKLSH